MGVGLAPLHEETSFEASGFPRGGESGLELDARESWHAVVCDFLADLCDWLEPHGCADVASAALAFVREHPGVLADVGEPVLCHGNYLPAHVCIAGGDVTCVIDFEHALVGPGEYDYWRAALPTFYSGGREDETGAAAFRAGYESVRQLPDGFDRRRECYWLVTTVSYLQSLFLQDQRSDEEERRYVEWMREFVFDRIDSVRADAA